MYKRQQITIYDTATPREPYNYKVATLESPNAVKAIYPQVPPNIIPYFRSDQIAGTSSGVDVITTRAIAVKQGEVLDVRARTVVELDSGVSASVTLTIQHGTGNRDPVDSDSLTRIGSGDAEVERVVLFDNYTAPSDGNVIIRLTFQSDNSANVCRHSVMKIAHYPKG